jgi:hypothetical protein
MFAPQGVGTCLYAGISKKIDWMKERLKWNLIHTNMATPNNYLERLFKDIVEATDWYNEHCVTSGKFLSDAVEELTIQYDEYKKGI